MGLKIKGLTEIIFCDIFYNSKEDNLDKSAKLAAGGGKMNLEELKRAGIHFDFCPNAVAPEIPYVQDVLFALRLTDEQKYFDFCVANHRTYIVNVGLVIAAVGYVIFDREHYNEAESRKAIARAILELCPEEARCLHRSAYIEARKIAREAIPPEGMSREQLLKRCSCPLCELTRLHDGFDDEDLHEVWP